MNNHLTHIIEIILLTFTTRLTLIMYNNPKNPSWDSDRTLYIRPSPAYYLDGKSSILLECINQYDMDDMGW